MPIYQYRCQSCSELHEALQKVSDERLTTCPHCGAEALKRIIAPVGIQFKGSGWHVTDYKSGGGSKGSSSSEEGGTDKKKSEDTSKASDSSKSSDTSKGSDSSKGSGDASASSKVA